MRYLRNFSPEKFHKILRPRFLKANVARTAPSVADRDIYKLQDGFGKLLKSKSSSLLKKYLNPRSFSRLQRLETPTYSSNLLDCVQCGFKCYDCPIGVYAPDVEAYEVFGRLFNPIIEHLHNYKKPNKHPAMNFGDTNSFQNIDPDYRFIYSTRIRVVRNIRDYPLAPKMTECHYNRLEREILPTLLNLDHNHKGVYHPEAFTFRSTQAQWVQNHIYKYPNRFMVAGGICRYHPTGRGMFHNLLKTFSVWINFEDHLRIISMQPGADFGQVYRRLVDAMNVFNSNHDFLHDEHLGFISCSPEHLGTGMRVSVLMRLENLPKDAKTFRRILSSRGLQSNGTYGRGTTVDDDVYDISNARTLGVTEYECVKTVYDGVQELIRLET